MAETTIPVTSGSGNSVDVFQLTNTNLRQAVVVGDSVVGGNVAPVQATDPSSNAFGIVVRDVNTSAIVAKLTTGVSVSPGTGTLQVQFDPGHELGSIKGINSSITVQFDPGHELGTIRGNTNTLTVFFPDTGHEIGTIRGNTNTLTVFLPDTGHTLGFIQGTKTTLAVSFDPGYTIGSIQSVKTTITVGFDPGYTLGKVDQGVASSSQAWLTNSQNTASIFTVSGSTSGVSVSGVNLVAPSASYNFKVFAYSLQTTAGVSLVAKFVNGAGGGQTEFWRPLITASGVTGAQGANLAVPSPSFIFATGTNTSLNILLDTASLVHYSVSFIKESA
jgi:hypothetical protein